MPAIKSNDPRKPAIVAALRQLSGGSKVTLVKEVGKGLFTGHCLIKNAAHGFKSLGYHEVSLSNLQSTEVKEGTTMTTKTAAKKTTTATKLPTFKTAASAAKYLNEQGVPPSEHGHYLKPVKGGCAVDLSKAALEKAKAAPGPKAAAPAAKKAKAEKGPKKVGSGERIRQLLLEGKDADAILVIIHKEFEGSKAAKSDVSWNKGWLKRNGQAAELEKAQSKNA